MAAFYDGFNPGFDLECPDITGENASSVMDEIFDLELPLYVEDVMATDTSWQSNSSEDLQTAEGFNQLVVNSSEDLQSAEGLNQLAVNSLPFSQHSVCTQSAFCKYVKADPMPVVENFKIGQFSQKRCLCFLRKIEKRRKLTRQMSMQTPPAPAPPPPPSQPQQSKSGLQNKSAFDHMLAERNRRVKLRQHFSNLCALVPKITKKDKHSILANTASYLQELKLRVDELEQHNQILQESVSTNKEDVSRGFESTEQSYNSDNTVIYRSDEVILEQWKSSPCKVSMKIITQKDKFSCPASLLIKQLDLLKNKQLEILSIQSKAEPFQVRSDILLRLNGQVWDVSKWQNFAATMRESLL